MKIFQPTISGSIIIGDSSLNIHQFTGSVLLNNGITGSLFGTASYAESALTASVALSVLSSSNSATSSYALDSDKLDGLDSTAFAILTASNIFTANQTITGSLNISQGITGSLLGTASYSNYSLNSLSSSYSDFTLTASFASNADLLDGLDSTAFASLSLNNTFTNNQIISGSLNVLNGITGSLLGTASFALNALTASFVSNVLTASYALNADLFDGLDSASFIRSDIDNTFNGNQIINGNVTINGTASVNVLTINYQTSSIIYTSGSTRFGNSSDDLHEFTGSINISNGITGSLLGTASFASNADLLDGLDSSTFATNSNLNSISSSISSDINRINNRISLTLDGVVSGSNPNSIGTFYIPTSSTYSVSSFIYFGGSQGNEEANIEFRLYSSPISVHTITKNTTLSISYLTSSLSLTAGLYNLYLYSSGSGSAIAKSLYLTT